MTNAAPVVLAGPSGTGKTTLARGLVASSPRYCFAVSATTRPPRPGEVDGVDYHFVERARFLEMVDRGEFAEWAEVHGELYGTPRVEIETAAREGRRVVLDIDVQGARQIRKAYPDATLIFVLPPSVPEMLRRLRGRGTEDHGRVARRLRSALAELRAAEWFDYVVVNDDLQRCLDEVRRIVEEGVAPTRSVTPEELEHFRAEVARVLETEYQEV